MLNSISDVVVASVLAGFLILGGYQVYFLPQRKSLKLPGKLLLEIDRLIPFRPQWVWVYSLLYYPLILAPIFTISDFRQFSYTAINFALLLVLQVGIAYVVPIKTPDEWRLYPKDLSYATKFLAFVQSIDRGGNCFPSMHLAVASLAILHILHNLPDISFLHLLSGFVTLGLISASALFTKQHYLLDLPAGMLLAGLAFFLHIMIYT